MTEDLGFWLAVMLMAVAGVALFKLAGKTKFGDVVPGARALGEFI